MFFKRFRIGFSILAALTALVSAGCKAVGPDFKGVAVPGLPATFDTSQPWHQPNLPERPEWHRFNDPILGQLIDTALRDSPNVRELQWRIREARAILATVNARFRPEVVADATYERRERSLNAQPFVGPNGDAFDFFSGGLNSRWEIDLFGQIRRETEAATADYYVTVEELSDIKRLLIGDISRAYIQVRLFQELERQNRVNLQLQRESLGKVKDRIEAGQVGRLDLVQIESRISLTAADRPKFSERLKLAINQLSILIGTPPNEQLTAWLIQGYQLEPPLVGYGVPADLLRHRPDMRRAERSVAAESARVGVETAELYPKLSLGGAVSLDSRSLSSLLSADSLAFALGPSFSWNLFSAGRVQNEIEAQKARWQQSIQRYHQTLLTAIGDVENALVSYHQGRQRLIILRDAVLAAEESVDLALEQYEADLGSLERVVSNQRRLLQATTMLAEARAETATAAVDLIQATGVGWSSQPNHQVVTQQPSSFVPQPPPMTAFDSPTGAAIHPGQMVPSPAIINPAIINPALGSPNNMQLDGATMDNRNTMPQQIPSPRLNDPTSEDDAEPSSSSDLPAESESFEELPAPKTNHNESVEELPAPKRTQSGSPELPVPVPTPSEATQREATQRDAATSIAAPVEMSEEEAEAATSSEDSAAMRHSIPHRGLIMAEQPSDDPFTPATPIDSATPTDPVTPVLRSQQLPAPPELDEPLFTPQQSAAVELPKWVEQQTAEAFTTPATIGNSPNLNSSNSSLQFGSPVPEITQDVGNVLQDAANAIPSNLIQQPDANPAWNSFRPDMRYLDNN